MKTLRTYWPKMRTLDKALITLQTLNTAINAIIFILNPTWPKAAMFAISAFALWIIASLTIATTQTRYLADLVDQAKDINHAS